MVTDSNAKPRGHLFIKEHMEWLGISDEKLAETLEVARETVWRWHTEQHRLNPTKIASIAFALGIWPEELYRPPGQRSLDALLKEADDETRKLAFDLVSRVVNH